MGNKFALFKRIIANKASQAKQNWSARSEKPKTRIDRDFPLDLRVGSKVTLNSTTLLLNKDVTLMDAFPKEMYVLNYGTYTLLGLKVDRFYLGESDEVEAVLQITNSDKLYAQVFTSFDEVYPENDDDWDIFIGNDEQLIGAPIFTNNDYEVDYWREWPEGDDWVRPLPFTETIYLDAFGEETVTVDHECMLYSRPLSDGENPDKEYLIVSSEDQDEESLVHMMLGIDIDTASIKVAF